MPRNTNNLCVARVRFLRAFFIRQNKVLLASANASSIIFKFTKHSPVIFTFSSFFKNTSGEYLLQSFSISWRGIRTRRIVVN